MTIERIWQSGFESGSINELPAVNGSGMSIQVAATDLTGSYCLRHYPDNPTRLEIDFTATNQARVGFRYRTDSGYSTTEIVRFQTSAGAADVFEIRHATAGGILTLYINDVLQDTSYGNILLLGQTRHISMDCKVDAASGWCKVYLDGEEIMSYSGNTGSTQIERLCIGNNTDVGSGQRYTYFDDIYVDDTTGEGSTTVPPLLKFFWVAPDGNGNYSQWDGSDGNSVDNYQLVDEIPPSTADYVETSTTAEFDSYTMGSRTLETNETINAVIPIAYVRREESTEEIALGTRLSSTDVVSSGLIPSNTYTYGSFYWDRQTTKPGGGSWGQADINAFEAILKSEGSY
jgi:hypothetical protein